MKVSLCMIVKDEEQNIGRCLQSVLGVVDEIIVVDTGSHDNTRQIAQSFGAKVQSFLWNDNFSDARNASLDLAQGDWILFLDADEELSRESCAVLRHAIENQEVEGYFNKIINLSGYDSCPETSADVVFRLFRNRPDYRFRGAVHEQICDVISEKNKQAKYLLLEDLIIKHYGYLNSHLQAKDKKRRNRILLEKELAAKPNNPLVRFHYAVELYRIGENLPAAKEFDKVAAEINPLAVMYGPKLMRYTVQAYLGANETAAALNAVQRGLQLFPDYADLYYFGGLIYYQGREYGIAYDYFRSALQAPRQPVNYASYYGIQGFRSYYYLGQIAEKFCNQEEALRYYIASLRDNNNFTAPIECIIRILEPRKNPDYTGEAINKLFDLSLPQAKLLIGEILFRNSAYSEALKYFDALAETNLMSQAVLYKAICLIQQRRSLEALHLLDSISAADNLFPYAKVNQLLCFWFEGNRQKVRSIADELLAMGLTDDTAAVIELLKNAYNKRKTLKSLGDEGMTLMLDIVKRALDLGEINLCNSVLSGISPQSLLQYYLPLAELFFEYGHVDIAEQYLYQHLQTGNKCAQAYCLLAEIKQNQQAYFAAIEHYQNALQCDPKEPKYYIKLIELYEKVRSELLKQAAEKYPDIAIFGQLLKEAAAKR